MKRPEKIGQSIGTNAYIRDQGYNQCKEEFDDYLPSLKEIEDIVTNIKLFGKIPSGGQATVKSELEECELIAKAIHKRIME